MNERWHVIVTDQNGEKMRSPVLTYDEVFEWMEEELNLHVAGGWLLKRNDEPRFATAIKGEKLRIFEIESRSPLDPTFEQEDEQWRASTA